MVWIPSAERPAIRYSALYATIFDTYSEITELTTTHVEPGARWLRCDLHVHTPFDGEKRFGGDIRGAIAALTQGDSTRLEEIAERFVGACQSADDGNGMDLVALADHNSIEGFKQLKPLFQKIETRAKNEGKAMPAILPAVEFSVGGERPIHFLVIFASDTEPADIEGVIRHVFQARECFNSTTGTPLATGESLNDFLKKLYEYAKPATGKRNLSFVLLPAHADGNRGVAKETGADKSGVAANLWDEMKGHLRQWAVARTEWNGFETTRPFERLPQAFQDLLCQWTVAKQGEDWDKLPTSRRQGVRNQGHWPLVEGSDPHNYEAIGSRYSWLKMEVPDVEGIRLALLDPQSRLRRMTEGPPGQHYTRIKRLRVRCTDFFEDIDVPFNACLTTLIGGRGSGKSTVVEYLRHTLDRARSEDLRNHETSDIRDQVHPLLLSKKERDFGDSRGTLLPDYEMDIDLVVAERHYLVRRSANGLTVIPDANQPNAAPAALDVRSLIVPRILSQRQIARIARNPASQRTELDALIDPDRLRKIENLRRSHGEKLAQFQTTRSRLEEQRRKYPSIKTELKKICDQIGFLESEGRKEVLQRFDAFERERRWLESIQKDLNEIAARLDEEAGVVEQDDSGARGVPKSTPTTTWLDSVAGRVATACNGAAAALREEANSLRALATAIKQETAEKWQADYDKSHAEYDALRQEMVERGVDFAQHEKLLQRRAQLERELETLQKTDQELSDIERNLGETRLRLVETHKARLAARLEQAKALEDMDADVRLEVYAFRDRGDFESRREHWFGGAGVQERDWTALCEHVFAPNGVVPDRIADLAKAIREDLGATTDKGAAIEASASKVVALVGPNAQLTKNFLNALERRERIRIDEIERFLPEDRIEAQVRTDDGAFKTIETGSIGQKSTAILSLLLSAGDQPIIIDQPEDDLDNQYVYNVVVDLLRRRKFSRQVIIVTHNANIPVNGDAELIVALGAKNRLGKVISAGSIDRPDVKNHVSRIMEGSAEAFRLRRERYGY